MRKYLKQAAVITVLTVVATVGISSPASAANYGSYVNRRTNACLDSNSSGDVYTLGCNSGHYQDWDIQHISGNLYYLRNRATDRCLDASDDETYTHSCNGGLNQRWDRLSSGYGQWKNHKTGQCLRGSVYTTREPVTTEECDSSFQTQKWAKI